METLLVYGLVVVFFVLLIPVIYFLMQDPVGHTGEPSADTQKTRAGIRIQPEKLISYGILTALLALMFVLTILGPKPKA